VMVLAVQSVHDSLPLVSALAPSAPRDVYQYVAARRPDHRKLTTLTSAQGG
jgi:hypothetical protein